MKIRDEYTCPLELTHDITKGKWKPIILWQLGKGAMSLAQLEKDIISINQKMLLEQLKELTNFGMVAKRTFEGYPLKVEYSLTERGKKLLDALALWYDIVFKKECRGEIGLVIYADDFVATFQYRENAERFLMATKDRFALFGLELEPTKTRLVEFGRFAEQSRKKRGEGKPETFDFLGFTHYCSKSYKTGWFRVKRRTAQKKYRLKLKEMNLWLKQHRHYRLKELTDMLNQKLCGHCRRSIHLSNTV